MSKSRQIESIVKKERGRLFNFIRKSVPVKEDAEDILQDVFSRFVEEFSEIEAIETIVSWLFTSARNKIIDKHRKKKTLLFNDIEISENNGEEELNLADIIPDMKELPDDKLIRDALWEEVEEALDELPDEQRDVFILNEFEGYSYKEISSMLNVPVNTLLSRKRYAVLYLRERLKELLKEI
jgi:RNA polymerase sigma factor (sigma-70 family)